MYDKHYLLNTAQSDEITHFGAKAFSQMNSSMVVKIGIVATVTVGGMAALSHPCERGIYTSMYCRCRRRAYRDTSCKIKGRRVTGETVTMYTTPIALNCYVQKTNLNLRIPPR